MKIMLQRKNSFARKIHKRTKVKFLVLQAQCMLTWRLKAFHHLQLPISQRVLFVKTRDYDVYRHVRTLPVLKIAW